MTGEDDLAAALAGLLCDLIAIPSPYPPGDTREIAGYAAARLRRAGYAVEVPSRRDGIDNVVARLGGGRPSLVFNAHVDTVAPGPREAWRSDPYRGTVREGAVHGLGAGNCKGSMAVQLWLADEIARAGGPARGEVVFTFVGDEERLGPDGLRFLREGGRVAPDMLVLGGQTENQLIVEERGVLWARIVAHGRAAHAGKPQAGENAILRMLRLVGALEGVLGPRLARRGTLGKPATMSLGTIRGGENANVVPSRCVAEIDRRLVPGESVEAAFAEIESALAGAGEPPASYEVELLTGTSGFSSPIDGPCVAAFRRAIEGRLGRPARFIDATGVSDGRHFAGDRIEILTFGPGSGAEGHAANESVAVRDLVDAAVIQREVVRELLGLRR
ncbi:MAG: ArgE/DapE family deacylase [Proteobacteria bacterium]|nr:ArgE/DapE family deacylase [Pseudomonadota bacterium]